jgi:membrane-associated protease RseP (regulator of RpoE activity)
MRDSRWLAGTGGRTRLLQHLLGIALCAPLLPAAPLGAQDPVPEQGQGERAERPGDAWRVRVLTTRRARLGVTVNMRARETDSIGALLQSVTPNGPAAKAGLRRGDIITRFNGQPLVGTDVDAGRDESAPGLKLTLLSAGLAPGDTVAIEYRRGSARKNASVVAGDEPFVTWIGPEGAYAYGFGDSAVARSWVLPPEPRRPHQDTGRERREVLKERIKAPGMFLRMGSPLVDLELAPLNRDLGRYFGTSEGVLVIRVPERSRLGLEAGDVVLAVDGRAPTSPAHLWRILSSYEIGEPFKLQIVRMKKREVVRGMLGAADD